MNITKTYKTIIIITLSCLALSTQSFAGKGGGGGGGRRGMNSGGGNSSGQQNRNRYGKQGGENYQKQSSGQQNGYGKQGGENYQNQGNGQQNRDRSDQQNRDGIATPVTTQDQE